MLSFYHVIPMFNHKFLIIHFCASSIQHASTYNFLNFPTWRGLTKTNFSSSCFSLILHKSHTNMCVVLHRRDRGKKTTTKWMSVLELRGNLWQERRVRIFLYLIKFKNMKLTVTKSIICFLFHAMALSYLKTFETINSDENSQRKSGERRTLKRDFSSSFYYFPSDLIFILFALLLLLLDI